MCLFASKKTVEKPQHPFRRNVLQKVLTKISIMRIFVLKGLSLFSDKLFFEEISLKGTL